MASSHDVGKDGEERAVQYLAERNIHTIGRNYRQKSGEIDIIALDGETIAFCEVKSWERMPLWGLEQAISRRKQGRIIRTSLRFLWEHPEYARSQPRFDVIFVHGEKVSHYRDAFSGNGVW